MTISDRQGLFKTVVDSAIVIGVFSGFCFLLGSLARVRAYRSIGIPRDLVPTYSPQATVSIGATYMIFFVALALLFYVLWVALAERVSAGRVTALSERIKKAYEASRVFYSLFFLLVLTTGVLLTPLIVPASFQSSLTEMTKVRTIELRETGFDFEDVADLRFICRSRGLLVFKNVEKQEVLVIPEDLVRALSLDVSKTRPLWKWLPWQD